MNLDTSYYNNEKTEYTVDHRTQNTNVKNEVNLDDNGTHYDLTAPADKDTNGQIGLMNQAHSQASNYMGQSHLNASTVVVDDDDGPNTFIDRKTLV